MIEVGQSVGNYRVLEKIAQGSMGDVYLAEHPVIGRKAALKVIHPQHARNVDVVADPDFVKVLDFGLAKLLHDGGAAPLETRAGLVVGTPYYMAPEQCVGARELDGRADVYALGVLLFEMLTGKLPFGGDSDDEVLMKQMTLPPPAARSLAPHVPAALDAIVRRALAKAPADRFPSMAAFGEALLAPGAHVPPFATRADENASGLVRDARPMSRAEIRLHRAPQAPTPAEP